MKDIVSVHGRARSGGDPTEDSRVSPAAPKPAHTPDADSRMAGQEPVLCSPTATDAIP
jgi:hypothetical protein